MKNIVIKINEKKSISLKDYLLEIVADKKYCDTYSNKKEDINSFIRQKVKSDDLNSMEVTKWLTEYAVSNDELIDQLRMKIERLENQICNIR
jgi:hypothetical protein